MRSNWTKRNLLFILSYKPRSLMLLDINWNTHRVHIYPRFASGKISLASSHFVLFFLIYHFTHCRDSLYFLEIENHYPSGKMLFATTNWINKIIYCLVDTTNDISWTVSLLNARSLLSCNYIWISSILHLALQIQVIYSHHHHHHNNTLQCRGSVEGE